MLEDLFFESLPYIIVVLFIALFISGIFCVVKKKFSVLTIIIGLFQFLWSCCEKLVFLLMSPPIIGPNYFLEEAEEMNVWIIISIVIMILGVIFTIVEFVWKKRKAKKSE